MPDNNINNDNNGLYTRISQLLRICMWAYLSNLIIKTYIFPQSQLPIPDQSITPPPEKQNVINPLASFFPALAQIPKYTSTHPHYNIWQDTQLVDLHIYMDQNPAFTPQSTDVPLYMKTNVVYGDYTSILTHSVELDVPRSVVLQNGTMYAHVFLTKHQSSPCPDHLSFLDTHVITRPVSLIQYLPVRKSRPMHKSLFNDSTDHDTKIADNNSGDDLMDTDAQLVGYWAGNVTIHPVITQGPVVPNQLPAFVIDWIDFLPDLKVQDDQMKVIGYSHKPPLWINDFWILREDLIPINATTTTLPLHIEYQPVSMFKFNLILSMKQSFQTQSAILSAGMDSSSGLDEVKRMLRDTNPWYLALTMSVSILHSVFEFLAFKNDVSHWKSRKNVTGISVRSMFVNLVIQVVIFLYLLDNSSETSMVIIVMNGIGLGIEVWKLSKATEIRLDCSKTIPRLLVKDKQSYVSSQTKTYDDEAFKYMKWLMYPLLFMYAVYALVYNKYKSWYSYVLETMIGAIYAFGFLQLLPQLFINYRLKSVAHLNGRAMTYKFLSTIVDDLFVFVIRMPMVQRLAAFRDDVVFVVYLYQRWIYRVDHSRVNEYGQGGGGEEEDVDRKKKVQ